MAGKLILPVLLLLFTGPLYPIEGTTSSRSDDGSSPQISLLQSFNFFGQHYSQIYVNHNGHLTFDSSWSSFTPQQFPMYGGRDIIAPYWTDLDNRGNGDIYYVQYTNGSILQQVTQDINAYFPGLNFHANWVFIATWHEVAYFPMTGTQTTIQAILTTNGQYSFVLMNYGSLANTSRLIQAGYDTISSSHHFSIPGSMSNNASGSNSIFSLDSNVNVPGRWVFRVDHGSTGSHAHLPAPASLSPSPVTLSARRGASAIVDLSSMVTNVCHQHHVVVIMKDAIGKLVNSSGTVKSVREFAPVMV
uniref:NIDO domain-containing protein n=1 Tax=Fundulus heteroclitus TaxID=8078 RepID=A0A3Q2PKK2_FUNHE